MRRIPLHLALVLGLALGPLGCGDGDDGGSNGDPGARAAEIADCTEQAGFEPGAPDDLTSGATAIDLTTETATIVLHVFPSAEEAAAAAPEAGLDAEQHGSVLILGGAIPPADREKIVSCL